MAPLEQVEADKIAKEWIENWNSHDLERILDHYDSDIVFTSPFAIHIAGKEDGTLNGISELRDYFSKALEKYPELHFQLFHVLPSVGSLVVHYQSVNNLRAAEIMELNSDTKKITRVIAHYSQM